MIFATRHRKLILFLFAAITVFFGLNVFGVNLSNIKIFGKSIPGPNFPGLSFGHKLENFFDKEEEVYKFNKEFFNQFEDAVPNSVMYGIKNEDSFDYSMFQEIDSFTHQLEKLPQVRKVFSITNQKLAIFSSLGTIPYDALNLDSEEDFNASIMDIDSMPDVKDKFIGKQGNAMLIYLIIKDSISIDSLVHLRKTVDSLAVQHPFSETIFANNQHNNHLITEKIKTDSTRLVTMAFIFIILILVYFFRSIVGIIVPFIIVVSTIIWIMGTIAVFGININVLTIAIPVIVGVISLSDVIHIISRYAEEKTEDKILKITATKKDILKAIILTTLTTSVGFLSFSNSNIQVFKEFSIFTALGVVYAFILAYFLLPVLLYYTKKITLHNSLNKLTPKKIFIVPTLIITGIFVVLSVIGISKVKHNHFFYENMEEKDEISRVMSFLEKDMYGIRDLTITAKVLNSNLSLFDGSILHQLDEIEQFIEKEYNATIELGLATSAKQVNRALNGGFASHFKIPEEEYEMKRVRSKLLRNAKTLRLKSFVSRKTNSTFIKTKTQDLGSNYTFKINDRLVEFAKINAPDIEINFGGNVYIIDKTNVNVSEGMIWNLLIIILAIFLIITFIFKSFSIGFLSLFPNILPLIAITAVVGWFDFGMNIATTIVYTIAFGIAVDDTIHFLGRYKIEIDKGVENNKAILTTIKTSGGAIFLTTLILVFGFGVLIFSKFYANYMTGLLVCVGLVMALLCDLYLLPVILKWARKGK